MAVRAEARAHAERVIEDRVRAQRRDLTEAQHLAPMTLREAVQWLREPAVPCACSGSPGCCIYALQHALALVRAAHIAIELITRSWGCERWRDPDTVLRERRSAVKPPDRG